jgi:folate-binding protein YgfZ
VSGAHANAPSPARGEEQALVPALEHLTVVGFEGADAREFLGRQLTCDVATLDVGGSLLGAWLSPKGRVITLLHLFDAGDGELRAAIPAALADDVVRRLNLFVLRDRVRVRRVDGWTVAGLLGEHGQLLAQWSQSAGLPAVFPLAPGARDLALLAGEVPSVIETCHRLRAAGAREASRDEWFLAQIRAAVPAVDGASRDEFLPQMLNLDRTGGVSFTKGCYPGQEIVARTQHLGRIKRRMFRMRCSREEPATPGQPIYSQRGGEAVGRVILAAPAGEEQELLAVLALDSRPGPGSVHLGSAGGAALEVLDPPYSLED